jgi:protein AATF/BFR2
VQKQHRITSVKDKRASKGRRLRYDVHEKLRDFMAVETSGVGWWEEGRARELFAGLMGGSEGLAEGEQGEDDMREDEDGAGALRLFA